MDLLKRFSSENDFKLQDILVLNRKLFGHENAKFKSYDKETISRILKYKFSNIEIAKQFHMSRNTIAKWRKDYLKSG